LTAMSRYQKLNQLTAQSAQQAIVSARQAHTAVAQAQSSLTSQEIQYAESKVSEALTYVRHVQHNMELSIPSEDQQNLKLEEKQLLQEYELFL